jgi:hypothetical protein
MTYFPPHNEKRRIFIQERTSTNAFFSFPFTSILHAAICPFRHYRSALVLTLYKWAGSTPTCSLCPSLNGQERLLPSRGEVPFRWLFLWLGLPGSFPPPEKGLKWPRKASAIVRLQLPPEAQWAREMSGIRCSITRHWVRNAIGKERASAMEMRKNECSWLSRKASSSASQLYVLRTTQSARYIKDSALRNISINEPFQRKQITSLPL